MKKLLIFLMIVIILASCANAQSVTPTLEEKSIETKPTTSSEIVVDPGLLNIEITLPNSFYSETDMATFDTDLYAKENKFKKAVVNADGSVTITMSKTKHKEILEESAANLNESFNEMVGSENTPYIFAITSNSDFTLVIVDVDRIGYESAFDLSPLAIGISSSFYQSIAGIKYHCEVIIRDKDTKDTISSVIYPDALQ